MGRPPLPAGQARTRFVSFRMKPGAYDFMTELAERRHITVTELARRWVTERAEVELTRRRPATPAPKDGAR